MRPHQTHLRIDRRRRHNRVAQWVGLLALAGLLAIATLPSHDERQVHADEIGAAHMEIGHLEPGQLEPGQLEPGQLETGSASWHG